MRRDPALALLLLLALVLRLSYLLQATSTPLFEVLLLDSEFYDRQAKALVAGRGWGEGVFFMNPFYPYFLALIYWIGGPRWWAVGLAQALMGTANCGLIFALGKRTWGRRVGLVGAALAACYGVFIFYDGALLTATPILFFNLMALYSLRRWQQEGGNAWLWGAGVCLGLSALARPLALLSAALLGGWFLARRRLRAWALLCLGCGVVVGPVAVRNYLVGGEFVLTTSSAGMNFYVGNNPQATGIYAQADFVASAEPDQEREGFLREAGQRSGQSLTPAQASSFWLGEGLAFIGQHPGAYLRLLGRKLYLFWNDVESQNNLSYYFARDWVGLLRFCALDWGVVAPLALAALFFGIKREPLFDWYTASYLVGCLLFFVSSEYRLPVVPILLLYTAAGLVRAQERAKAREWGNLAVLSLVALALGAGINYPDELVRRLKSRRVDYYNFAMLYERLGEYRRAEELVRRALQIDPEFALGQQALARLQQRQTLDEPAARGLQHYAAGEYQAALEIFAGLVEKGERRPQLYNDLGLCYYKTGQFARAEEAYRRALSLEADYALGHYNLGILYLAQGKAGPAEEQFRQTLALDPGSAAARYQLGEALGQQGRRQEALAEWEELLRRSPGDLALRARVDSLRGR